MSHLDEDKPPRFKGTRPTGKVTQRRYRSDKRHPQRIKVIVKEDLGTLQQTQTFWMESNVKRSTRPKQKNDNLVYIMKTPLKIVFYKNSKRTFVYDSDGNYCGEFEKHDLRTVFNKIGALLKLLKKRNG